MGGYVGVQFSVKDGRLPFETLWEGRVGLVYEPSHSGRCLWPGPVVYWAGEGDRVWERGESYIVVLGSPD